jgi:hypothetical protein
MADGFTAAAGYGNLPNGKWSPTIYSKNVLDYLKRISVADEITNTDYTGEIKDKGDVVKIIKAPVMTVRTYERGATIVPQDFTDEELELAIDQANYWAFRMDDIEKQMSHVNWEASATESAAYELKDAYDVNVLSYMVTNSTDTAGTGTSGSGVTIGFGAGNSFTPYDYLNRFARLMDENDVPEMDRYFVASPAFWEQLGREDSKLIDVAVTGDPDSIIRARKNATSRPIAGFKCYKSNNLPTVSSKYTVLAGHKSSTATAVTILKSEKQRLIETFGEQSKGLMVFGRKVLRPEALFAGYITSYGDA